MTLETKLPFSFGNGVYLKSDLRWQVRSVVGGWQAGKHTFGTSSTNKSKEQPAESEFSSILSKIRKKKYYLTCTNLPNGLLSNGCLSLEARSVLKKPKPKVNQRK